MSALRSSRPSFVVAASVAAELHHAMNVARRVSLIAKNARAIAVRAGQESVGFKAITNFIDELARSMITQADSINRIAIGISRTAVMQLRASDARARFAKAITAINAARDKSPAGQSLYLESVQPSRQRVEDEVVRLTEQLDKVFYALSTELEETQRQIRAADIIATTSKVEASRAGEYRTQLEVIAQSIQRSADEIKTHLSAAQMMMREFKEH